MMMDFNKNGFIEIQKISKENLNLKERKKIKNESNKIIENKINKRRNKIIGNINKISNCMIINIIKSVILFDIYNKKVKNNVFAPFNFPLSNIILKIKGIGYNYILCQKSYSWENDFNSIYYPNEVYINGNKQDIINNNYLFNETNNYVELI